MEGSQHDQRRLIRLLITGLQSAGLDPTPREIADSLWLASRITLVAPDNDQPEEGPGNGMGDPPVNPPLPPQRPPGPEDDRTQSPGPSDVPLDQPGPSTGHGHLYTGREQASPITTSTHGLILKTPSAPALPGILALSRALRPLKRRVPSFNELVLDEAATADRIADEGIWLPVLRPAPSRWLDLALVIDRSESMVIWEQVVVEIRALFQQLGALRNVRVWNLFADDSDNAVLRVDGPHPQSARIAAPSELVNPAGRRLILIVSDCVSPAWYRDSMIGILSRWSLNHPIGIIDVLPRFLWAGSALGMMEDVLLHGRAPGLPGAFIDSVYESEWLSAEKPTGPTLPVMTLEPQSLASWVQMLRGAADARTTGVEFISTEPGDLTTESHSVDQDLLTPLRRVQMFRESASETAQRLIEFFAAAPLTLPIMRLIQRAMMPAATQTHFAECFLGGLLVRIEEPTGDQSGTGATDPDSMYYDFHPEVRDLLLDTLPTSQAVTVLSEVSRYIGSRFGKTLDFRAILADPEGINVEQTVGNKPFARVASSVLQRLGGRYSDLARKISNQMYGHANPGTTQDGIIPPLPPAIDNQSGVGERWAIVIGINTYEDPDLRLKYCVRDARKIAAVLPRWGFAPERIRLFTEESATIGNIRAHLSGTVGKAAPGDLIWIHFSGYGDAEGVLLMNPDEQSSQSGYRIADPYLQLFRPLEQLNSDVRLLLAEVVNVMSSKKGLRAFFTIDAGGNEFIARTSVLLALEPLPTLL